MAELKSLFLFLLFIPLLTLSQTCDVDLIGYDPETHKISVAILNSENCGCNEYTQQDGSTCSETSPSAVGNNESITHFVFGLHYNSFEYDTPCAESTQFHPNWTYVSAGLGWEFFSGDTANFTLDPSFGWECILNNPIDTLCWELVVWQINLSQTADIEDFPIEYWTDTCGTCANQTQMYPDIDLSNNTIIWCPGELPPPPLYPGCTDPEAENYDPNATVDDGSCIDPPIYGCTDPIACNYSCNNPPATVDDGSCVYCDTPNGEELCDACQSEGYFEWYSNIFNCNQEGCTDPDAINYNEEATEDDGSCEYSPDAFPSAGFNSTICDNGVPANLWNITVYNPDTGGFNATDTLFVYCVEIPEIGFDECQNGYEVSQYWMPPGEGQYINTVTIPGNIETFTVNVYYAEDEYEGYTSNNIITVQNIIQDPGVCIFPGCTDPEANNYDQFATEDDGSCTYDISGCTDPEANNFNPEANIDDGSCEYDIIELTYVGAECYVDCDLNGPFYYVNTTWTNTGNIEITNFCAEWDVIGGEGDDVECFNGNLMPGDTTDLLYGPYTSEQGLLAWAYLQVLNGVTLDPPIDNYETLYCWGSAEASCIYGCIDAEANNYNPNADLDDGSCTYDIFGCTDPEANNYDPNANIDNGSCTYDVLGCTDSNALNYNPLANVDDGSCEYNVFGCTDPNAENYNELATVDDGSCYYLPEPCDGSYYAPNTFTPNNDGVNDGWTVIVADPDCWKNWYIAIYNRWGGLVWESTTVGEIWPASVFNGNHYVADGVYLYLVRGEGWNPNHTFKSTGHITIFR